MTKSTSPLPPRHNRLREQREKSRLTQKEVAKLLDIDFTTVSAHENGRRGLTTQEIIKYAAVYKVESYELFLGEKPPEAKKKMSGMKAVEAVYDESVPDYTKP